MGTTSSDKIVVYRTITDNRVRKLYIFAFILALIIFSVGTYLQIRDDKSSFMPLFFILIYPFVWILPRLKKDYAINDIEKTIKIPTIKNPIEIELITKIDVLRNKRGKIKRLIIRIPPYRYLAVEPAQKIEFINHLCSINQNIELVEK